MRRTILTFVGIIGFLAGALWTLQGLGLVKWPAESFMISQKVWVWRGGALAIASLVLILAMRTIPDKGRG